MKKIIPSLPSGMRDFTPQQVYERDYILNIIKENFQKYGFEPIETPAIEKLSILTEKYGDEGDKLIYKIINSGDFLKNTDIEDFNDKNKLLKKISEKALRYDLTVPLARYIAMNQDKHPFPFKRYQIQNVWRADRPQKGRFREFCQCDVDIIGTNSILSEVELITMATEILNQLKIKNFKIKINHRKLLKAFSEYINQKDKATLLSITLDKVDKIGLDNVLAELKKNNISDNQINKLKEVLQYKGTNEEILLFLKNKFQNINYALEGLEDIQKLLTYLKFSGVNLNYIKVDPTIARGLAYYTGTVFEIIVENSNIGSIGGGGRYDEMASVFGLKNSYGIGFAFGLDRIWSILKNENLIPRKQTNSTQILITLFDEENMPLLLKLSKEIRKLDINTELYPAPIQIKKQLSYANKRNIPFIVILGKDEITKNKFILKNMKNGEQHFIPIDRIENILNFTSKSKISSY
ncbi:MAG: histidine--tRNA ligase [Bacteroidetes bacterium]|nr:histidine--tRNA ligase [Bacteroidota bacterium]